MGRGLGALEKFLRLWSPLGIVEAAYAMMPWWALAAAASFFWNSWWLDGFAVAGALYLLSSAALMRAARWWSRKSLGLHRYIVVPIPRWAAVALVRGRLSLPRGRRYFLLHVRADRGLDPRRMAREMREDVRRAVESEWTSGVVFLGNTFGSLGTRQRRLLEKYGEVVVVSGTFLPGQTWMMRTAKYQKRMFGRGFGRGNWQVVRFTPHK